MKINLSGHHCYVPGDWLHIWLKSDIMVNWIIKILPLPGKTQLLTKEPLDKKVNLIEEHLEHLTSAKASGWTGSNPADVVVASVFRHRKDLPKLAHKYFFSLSENEKSLRPLCVDWLKQQGLEVYREIDMGPRRVDLVGIKRGGMWSRRRVVAVELKNTLKDMYRGADQVATFTRYADKTYVACTPYMALEFLEKHANGRAVHNWDSHELEARLTRSGLGLLIVADGKATLVHDARPYTPDVHKRDELEVALVGKKAL